MLSIPAKRNSPSSLQALCSYIASRSNIKHFGTLYLAAGVRLEHWFTGKAYPKSSTHGRVSGGTPKTPLNVCLLRCGTTDDLLPLCRNSNTSYTTLVKWHNYNLHQALIQCELECASTHTHYLNRSSSCKGEHSGSQSAIFLSYWQGNLPLKYNCMKPTFC